ncbi:unnamed protein product [Toxocara canis]|uniref:Tyrosine-protein kinase n=1 Tax=Toxocara canis TaxID=6265 RepID=A0A183UDC8_TOXCA|nr:unnamed protein product [Toxocara canis]
MASVDSQQQRLIESIERYVWYHGMSSKEDIAPLLTEVGDWLLRAVDSASQSTDSTTKVGQTLFYYIVDVEIVLSVFIDNPLRVFNFHIKVDDEMKIWRLSSAKKRFREFSSLAELIKYYEENDLPGGYRLKRAISRPAWMISHTSLVYDINSNVLGQGNFCTVVKGKFMHCKTGNYFDVALKIWNGKSEVSIEDRRKAHDSMIREAKLISGYMHDNIVQSFGVACDRPPVIIVMEFCPGGCLERHLHTQGDLISAAERVVYCLDVAKGMRYLHCKSCIHRDIACRNCLISAQGLIKIADFGLSRLIDDLASEAITIRRNEQLPVRWMAPETLCRMPQFSKKSDVWSYGILCLEGIIGQLCLNGVS